MMKRIIVRGVNKNCRSSDPSTCRYHGEAFLPVSSPFTHVEQMFERVDKDLTPSMVIPVSVEEDEAWARLSYEEDNLTLEQRVALHRYSDQYGSMHIRTVLMNPEKTYDFNGETMESIHSNIAGLDSLIDEHSIDVSQKALWRGVKDFKYELTDIEEGSVFTNVSYTPTSADPEVAVSFSTKESPILLKIKAKEGYSVGGQFMGEKEVLLKRGSSFKVTRIMENVHVEKRNLRFGSDAYIRGITLVEVEVIE